jgi:hypothetical protein
MSANKAKSGNVNDLFQEATSSYEEALNRPH